jgi:heme oxygenase
MATTRDRLRNETRDVHERLHGHPSFNGLVEQSISQQRYVALLSRLLGYHCGMEAALKRFCVKDVAFAPFVRERTAHLSADLAQMRQSPAQIDAAEHLAPPDYIKSNAALLGCLYVREGAMIGGRSLARNLDHLCGSSSAGRTFFQGVPEDAQIWRHLCSALNLIEDQHAQDQIIEAALSTFALFETWMDGMEPISASGVTL